MVTIDCAACKYTFEIDGFEGEVVCPKCDTTMQVIYGDDDDPFEELQGDIDDFGPQYFDSHQEHKPLVE